MIYSKYNWYQQIFKLEQVTRPNTNKFNYIHTYIELALSHFSVGTTEGMRAFRVDDAIGFLRIWLRLAIALWIRNFVQVQFMWGCVGVMRYEPYLLPPKFRRVGCDVIIQGLCQSSKRYRTQASWNQRKINFTFT